MQSSAYFKLPDIQIPALIITAQNDPFLSGKCYPKDIAKNHKYLDLEITAGGGHVGFTAKNKKHWLEKRVIDFCKNVSK